MKLVYRYNHSEVREENICLWYSIYICFLFQIENVMYNSNLFLDIFQFSPYLLFNIGFALVKLLMFAYHYRNWTPIAIGIRYLSLLPQIPIDYNKLFVLHPYLLNPQGIISIWRYISSLPIHLICLKASFCCEKVLYRPSHCEAIMFSHRQKSVESIILLTKEILLQRRNQIFSAFHWISHPSSLYDYILPTL